MDRQVLVINSINPKLATTLAASKAGALGAQEDGSFVAAVPATAKNLQFTANGYTTHPFAKGDLIDARKAEFKAGTPQTTTIDLASATPDASGLYNLIIVDRSQPNGVTYESRKTVSAEDAAEMISMINELGANTDLYFQGFSASAGSGQIVEVTGPAEVPFTLAIEGGATITTTQVMEPAFGTSEKVLAAEEAAIPLMGGTHDGIRRELNRPSTNVVDGEQYEAVFATFQTRETRVDIPGGMPRYRTIRIAFFIKGGGTPGTDLTADDLITELNKLA